MIIFSASHGFPGCLPEGDGSTYFADATDAWDYLREMLTDEEAYAPDDEEDPEGPHHATPLALALDNYVGSNVHPHGTVYSPNGYWYSVDALDAPDHEEGITTEYGYWTVPTETYLSRFADADRTDYWRDLIGFIGGRESNHGVTPLVPILSTWDEREIRDRIIRALGNRHGNYSAYMSGHTSNSENGFADGFGWVSVDVTDSKGGPQRYGTVLVFVSMGDYLDHGLSHVYELSTTEEADVLDYLTPTVGYECSECSEYAESNDGLRFEPRDDNGGTGDLHRAVADDSTGVVTCTNGHPVGLVIVEPSL